MDGRNGTKKSWNRSFFATVSQEKNAYLLWSCVTLRRKLHGERNNAKYTSGQRRPGRPKTLWRDNTTKWSGLTGDRLVRSVKTEVNGERLFMKRPILGPRYKQCLKSPSEAIRRGGQKTDFRPHRH